MSVEQVILGTLVADIEGGVTYTSLSDGTTTLTSTIEELNYVDGVTSLYTNTNR